jgi:hypothetical protein
VTDEGNFSEGGAVNILNRLPPSLLNEGFSDEAEHTAISKYFSARRKVFDSTLAGTTKY